MGGHGDLCLKIHFSSRFSLILQETLISRAGVVLHLAVVIQLINKNLTRRLISQTVSCNKNLRKMGFSYWIYLNLNQGQVTVEHFANLAFSLVLFIIPLFTNAVHLSLIISKQPITGHHFLPMANHWLLPLEMTNQWSPYTVVPNDQSLIDIIRNGQSLVIVF